MISLQIDSHRSYQQRCRCLLQKHYKNLHQLPKSIRKTIHLAFSADLSHVDRIMREHYSKFGPAPRPASCMLRSLILSILQGTSSITKWVDLMRSNSLYAIISGFSPDDVPGVGTFYDFISRLWKSDHKNFSPNIRMKTPKVKKPKHKGDKADPVEKTTAEERLNTYLNSPINADQPFSILFKIFEQFLFISHRQGLIDLNNLNLAGDGTPVVTSARFRNRNLLESEFNDSYKGGERYFSQPDCDVGWDSSRYCYYVGYDLYLLTDIKKDLPIFPLLGPGSRHDSIACIDTWFSMKSHMPYAKVNSILLDSAHDAMCYYKYFEQQHITPYIDLNRRASKPELRDGFYLDDNHQLICPSGKKMWRDGTDYKRMRTKYVCPMQVKLSKMTVSTCESQPTDSLRGCVMYLTHKENPRYFTVPARNSQQWKTMYNKRTSSERCNKRIKIDFKLEDGKHRSSQMWYFRLYCIMMCQHLNAWSLPTESEPWMN